MTNELQVSVWPEKYPGRNIYISMVNNHIEVRQGEEILGAIEIEPKITDDRKYITHPLIVIRIVEGYKERENT